MRKVILIVGPTASGKTDIAISLAQCINGEIISADSRQVYKYLDIGTAKPSPEQLQAVKHHCINIKDPDESFNAGMYGKLAREIVDKLLANNKLPVVVGGSGLYIRALVDGMFQGNYKNEKVREELRKELADRGRQSLYFRLKNVDPHSADKIHPHDTKRILRALEVYEITGESISALQQKTTVKGNFIPFFLGLHWPRKLLYKRIDERVDEMMESGFIKEVDNVLKMGYSPELNSLDSLGYREIISYLKGNVEYSTLVKEIKKNTRRYAKKQLTWFRNDSRIKWIEMHESINTQELLDIMLEYACIKKKNIKVKG